MSRPTVTRCALYTRKSSEEGLDQAFNSLDAQREACTAYVASQAGEGWQALAARYDDAGISGGTMERPALQRLLADIAAGEVDVVVVYKIDRLTRSLADFARMVDLFDTHGVSFLSVTQAFNTTSSMGRLTLNVLLSFAQFEREVTGERIRDKIAASKQKGMWLGGVLPLGYDAPEAGSRALRVNGPEAETVRLIFRRYLDLGSVHELERWLAAEGIRSKRWVSAKGRALGGARFSRGALFHLLRNPVYLDQIRHRQEIHPGQHPAILEADLFEAVQRSLDAHARRTGRSAPTSPSAPLTGRIFDAEGHPMSPTTARGAHGKRYRYYVSAPIQQGRYKSNHDPHLIPRRIPARAMEQRLSEIIAQLIPATAADPLALLRRVEVHRGTVRLRLPAEHHAAIRANLAPDDVLLQGPSSHHSLEVVVPLQLHLRSGRVWITGGGAPRRQPDPALIKGLRTAHAMLRRDGKGLPVLDAAPSTPYRRRLVRLAFLAPELQRQILEGRQPPGLTRSRLIAADIPLDWSAQAEMFQGMALPNMPAPGQAA